MRRKNNMARRKKEILEDVIIELKEQGFRFGTLDELSKE